MRKWFIGSSIVLLIAVTASLAAAYAHGHFRQAARGAPSQAIPVQNDATALDRSVHPLTEGRPEETGLRLLPANVDALALRVLTVRQAERSLDSFYYIWQDDLTGNFLLRELLEAAERGVRVRLLIDDIGVGDLDEVLAGLDGHENLEIRLFNPTHARESVVRRGLEMALRFSSMNRRMHNKAWIADGRIGVVGGRNIGDAYFDADEDAHFNDLDLAVVGSVLEETEALFDEFWNSEFALPISSLRRGETPSLDRTAMLIAERLDDEALAPYQARLEQGAELASLLDPSGLLWTSSARLLADPVSKAAGEEGENWIMHELAPLLRASRHSVEIMSPYFVPKEEGTQWFVDIAQGGVDVAVLTNSLAATDVAAVHGGYAPFREPLLRGGVRLFELRRSGNNASFSLRGSTDAQLHTKAFTVDDRLAFVGSLNFDPRSVSLNTEMGVVFEVPELVGEIRALFAEETSPRYSYSVTWTPEGLRWSGQEDGQTIVLHDEPNASLWRRTIAGIMAVLPLDSQL